MNEKLMINSKHFKLGFLLAFLIFTVISANFLEGILKSIFTSEYVVHTTGKEYGDYAHIKHFLTYASSIPFIFFAVHFSISNLIRKTNRTISIAGLSSSVVVFIYVIFPALILSFGMQEVLKGMEERPPEEFHDWYENYLASEKDLEEKYSFTQGVGSHQYMTDGTIAKVISRNGEIVDYEPTSEDIYNRRLWQLAESEAPIILTQSKHFILFWMLLLITSVVSGLSSSRLSREA